MINTLLLYFMLIPLGVSLGVWLFNGRSKDGAIFAGGFFVISMIVVAVAFYAARGIATSDTEIWNGKVTAKERVHGSYVKTYECRCRETCSGTGAKRSCTKTCDTCYEDRYTVNWGCSTTVGGFSIAKEDWGNQGVYLLPDPPRYTSIKIGEPAARNNSYTNYIQAAPQSLFKPASTSLKKQFEGLLPAYPDDVFDFYRINRFLTPGYVSPDAAAWNSSISELLKERGPKKQVNAIVVIAKTADPNYAYALQDAWVGAKKNDVVLVIGSVSPPQIDFVEVLSWTKNELFKVQLRDSVMALGQVQREPIMGILAAQIDTNFERRKMREFAYLESEIDPPNWLLITLGLMVFGSGAGLAYYVKRTSLQLPAHTHRVGGRRFRF